MNIVPTKNWAGAREIGKLDASAADLLNLLGKPQLPDGQGDNTSVAWTVEIDGELAIIYDVGPKWMSPKETPDEKYEWTVAGRNPDILDKLAKAVGYHMQVQGQFPDVEAPEV